MPVAAQLIAEVKTTGVSEAESQLKGMGSTVEKTGGFFKGMLGNMLSIAGGIGIANLVGSAFGFLKDQLGGVLQESMDAQDELAQTNKVLLSTHDASGMTSQAILDLAANFSHLTKFTDDQVQVGENMLLTFTNIGKNVFPQATQTMLDLSQAMGQDVKSSAIQLGKALNDPLTGMTALQRVGVTFDDTEKKLIKTYMSHNELAKAQGVILQELQKEFGGSAEAAGKTFAGQLAILHQRLDDVKQSIGDALLPILTKLVGFISNSVLPAVEDFTGKLVSGIGSAITWVGNVLKSIDLTDFKEAWKAVSTEVGYVVQKFSDLTSSAKPVGDALEPLANILRGLAQGGLSLVTGLLWDLSGAFIAVDKQVESGKGPLIDIGNALKDAFSHIDFGQIINAFKQLGQIFLNFSPGINLFQALARHAQDLGKWFQTSVVPALKEAQPAFEQLAGVMLHNVLPAISIISDIFHNTFQRVFDALLPVFEKAVPIIIRFAGVIASGLGPAIQFLTPYVVQAAAAIGQFAGDIATRVAPIIENWFDMMDKALTQFLQIWNAVWPYLGPILKGVWDEIVGVVKIAWALVKGIVEIGLDLLSGNWKQAWEDFKTMLSGVWDGIKQVLKGAWEIIAGWATGAWNLIASAITGPMNKTSGQLNNTWTQIKNAVSTAWHAISSTISGIVTGITSWLVTSWRNAVNQVVGAFSWLYNHNYYFKALVDTIRSVVGAVVDWLVTAWQNVTGWIGDKWNWLAGQASATWRIVSSAISSATNTAVNFLHGVWNSVIGWLSGVWNTISSKVQQGWSTISGIFSSAWGRYIAGPLGGLGNSISGFFGGLANQAFTWGRNVIQGIVNGINNMLGAVGNAASNVASKIAGILGFHSPTKEGPGRESDKWAPAFINMFTSGLRAGIPQIEGMVARLAKPLAVNLNATSPGFSGGGHYAFPSMVGAAPGSGGSNRPMQMHVEVYLDGQRTASQLMPHIVNHIRYHVGTVGM